MKLAWLLVATLGINSAHAAADLPVAMQQVLHDWQAPGMAIAIVHDQQVLFVGGMGKRKLGEPAAVDAHTRFAIASLTKTFTAAAVLTLVEEGKLSLDAPVKDLWPALTLSDPTVTSQLTLRDILSHRSGIDESADLLWTSTGYDRSEVLQRLRTVPQASPLRSRFSYSNVLYVLAGEVAARVAGQPWESLVRTRLLAPANLTDAGFGIPTAADGNVAHPHTQRQGVITAIAPRAVDNIAPAAALFASASDLASWLKVWLHTPALDGKTSVKPVLSKTLIDLMMTPQMLVGLRPWAKALYPESHFLAHGLGWMLQDYRGKMVAWNTGGLDGFSCSLAVLPEEKFGVAVLTNVPWTGLPEAMVFQLIDDWLGQGLGQIGKPVKPGQLNQLNQIDKTGKIGKVGNLGKDWSGIRLKMSLESRARQAAARAAQDGTQTSTTFPIPVERLIGKYSSPMFGDAEIGMSTSKEGLSLRIAKSLRATLSPWQPQKLRVQFEDPELGHSLGTILTAKDGTVLGFELEDHGKFLRSPNQ